MKSKKEKMTKKNKYSFLLIVPIVFIPLIGGIFIGMILQQHLFYFGLVQVAEGLEGTNFNIEVDFNETLMTDRITENMQPILWDIRMQNCTETEKGYCAIECYENGKLMPCENFTADEHFCNNGKCEVSGICPTYYEILRGKTISDCIKEVEE
jgi:hypothetical protein